MKLFLLIFSYLLVADFTRGTLSPPKEKSNKKEKNKINKKAAIAQDVFQRNLVSREPKVQDIIHESSAYFQDTGHRRFSGNVLGYITPWNANGFEVCKAFHGKFTMVSPVWLTLSSNNRSSYEIPTHDVQKKWIKEMKTANNEEHLVKLLPRILFEQWTVNDVVTLHRDTHRQSDLVSMLINTAKTYRFDGYVLEIWNQFAFAGVDMNIVISLVQNVAQKLRKQELDIILAVPPSRGTGLQLFTRDQFDRLSPYVQAFSLMTYDYSSVQRPGPNSPLDWARQCVELLVPDQNDPRRAQILLGINFYGYHYTTQGGGPMLGTDYLKALENFKGKIQWDDRSKEHFFAPKLPTGNGFIFYPTLYSIKHRIDLAAELGTGISIWELGQGLNYFYDLL